MRILVTAATKHGATLGIAEAIADRLTSAGFTVDCRLVAEVASIADYDAVVIGSGVYVGHWLDGAKRLVEREAPRFATRPVWLFSSGPLGDSDKPVGDPVDLPATRATTHAIDHRVFSGRIALDELGLAEKVIFRVVRSPQGDFRDWEEIAAWADEIAQWLRTHVPAAVTG